MDDSSDVDSLVAGLLSESENVRKFAVFRLQSLLGDPAFADAFVQSGNGLLALRKAVLESTGNTQAYSLGSLNKLLELNKGWEAADFWVVDKAVALAVNQQLINIVRNALTLLVRVVGRPLRPGHDAVAAASGFAALKPALDRHPTFLEALVSRLSASDHGLCATALLLINALMRDAIANGGEQEWPRFVKRLQDLGVIGGVGTLMRGNAADDAASPLPAAVLEFQGLTKTLLRKWRAVRVNLDLHEHKKALKSVHLLSKPEPFWPPGSSDGDSSTGAVAAKTPRKQHHPEKWRRLGFETESPTQQFDETGYLGMMDLVEYAKRNEEVYQRTFMEQAVQLSAQRCPIARTSLSVTLVLYEHFDIAENAFGLEEMSDRRELLQQRVIDARANGTLDALYRPLLLQWARLHTAATNAFVRLWKVSGAESADFYKIEELIRVIIERIVGGASRKSEVAKVEEELREVTLATARQWQAEALDEIYDDAWGPHLVQVREQLRRESLQFLKEQRIRCLLEGAWFPLANPSYPTDSTWRFVRLSPTRRWLHYRDYVIRGDTQPSIDSLPQKLDLRTVTSVDSSVSQGPSNGMANGANGSAETLKGGAASSSPTTTNIAIIGASVEPGDGGETTLLTLLAPDTSLASEWLDGLLMLLNQAPITSDTARVASLLEDWGVRLRLLNLRWEDVDWEGLELAAKGRKSVRRPVPSREGLDGQYWYRLPDG